MEITYTILGGDGKQYGPITLEQLKSWVAEGRVDRDTQVWRSDQPTWSAASSLPELDLSAPPTMPGASRPADVEVLKWQSAVRSGASWFYWIAGLSLINSVSSLAGGGWGFIIGLGITQVIDAVAKGLGSSGLLVAILLDLAAAGVFVFFGLFANKRASWAFMIGMVLYVLDGLIFVLAGDWLGAGFHAFALFCIFSGFQANRKLNALGVSRT